MFEAIRRHKTLLGALALALAPLLVYAANARAPERATPLDRLVLLLTAPLERALAWTVDGVADTWAHYVDVRGARDENTALRRQVMVLEREAAAREGLEDENTRLRTLLGLSQRHPTLALLSARVIAESPSSLERSVRIDRGLQHGVRRGMAVLAARGLVGRVQRVGYGYAVVALIADEKVSLDVLLGRSRVHGRLRGSGLWPATHLDVVHVMRTDDVRVGDVVLTSGLAGVYPEGVPVAVVSRVEVSAGGQEQQIEVTPLVDFGRLEEVMVVTGPADPEEPLITPEELLPPELQAPGNRARTSSSSSVSPGLAAPRVDAGLAPPTPTSPAVPRASSSPSPRGLPAAASPRAAVLTSTRAP